MIEKQELSGGREGKIHKQGKNVIRPSNPWSKHIHDFLDFMHSNDAPFVPNAVSLTDTEETLSFMLGDVYNYPLPKIFLTHEMLISASSLLKRFHEFGERYIQELNGNEQWMLEKREPIEVMCHGDFAPYNVTIINNKASNIIDFDTLHPGPIMWDIAYAIYRWVPFKNPNNPDCYHDIETQIQRTKVFLDNYGVSTKQRHSLVDVMIQRLESLINYMTNEAKNGNEDFQKNIDDGHMQAYIDDVEYLKVNKTLITDKIG